MKPVQRAVADIPLTNAGLVWVTFAVYAVAGAVSWQRAALAVLVLVWTVHHQARKIAPRAESATTAIEVPRSNRDVPAS